MFCQIVTLFLLKPYAHSNRNHVVRKGQKNHYRRLHNEHQFKVYCSGGSTDGINLEQARLIEKSLSKLLQIYCLTIPSLAFYC